MQAFLECYTLLVQEVKIASLNPTLAVFDGVAPFVAAQKQGAIEFSCFRGLRILKRHILQRLS